MRITCLPSDRTGCGMYRLIWNAEAIAREGHDVQIVDHLLANWEDVLGTPTFRGAARLDADVVVFQRVFRPDMLALMLSIREQGIAVVCDVDDDLAALGPAHPVYHQLRPGNPSGKSWEVMREACLMADMVTVSTPALAKRYGGHGRVRVVPNGIPAAYLQVTRSTPRSKVPVIGWPGTPVTHPGDLEMTGTAVQVLCQTERVRFRAIGSRTTLDVLTVPLQEYQPGVPLADLSYARAVAELDIGMVPLRRSVFNEAKSSLKMSEMAAVGVPCVVSPSPENLRLHELGVGLVAHRPREWKRHLLHLAESADLRLAMGAEARAVMAGRTIEAWVAPQAFEAWEAALRNARSRRGGPILALGPA